MKLIELIKNIKIEDTKNIDKNTDITGISYNSQTTNSGDFFICLVGEHSDGHNYAKMAEEKGAKALLVEHFVDSELPQIVVKSTRHTIADVASAFYKNPSQDINLIGVTGTNGKTTITHLLQTIFEAHNKKCAIIGTLGNKLSSKDEYKDAKHTTPQAPELQALFSKMKNEHKIENIAMEVSSHSLEQKRVGNCDFKCAVLTNLTQDHLDYHITMDNYFDAKAILFKGLKKGYTAVINADDEYAKRFIDVVPKDVNLITYGIKNQADVMAKDISFSGEGAKFTCKTKDEEFIVSLKMNGMFSVYNVLAALATSTSQGFDIKESAKALEQIKGVAGRFEVVAKNPLVIVDYAHTPDGLENVLKAGREITPVDGNLICIFGCGGDRDATKRPKMASIAEKLADKIIITSDNPRSENPELIISDIMTGIKSVNSENIKVEIDRRKAIELSKTICKSNDVIVIAGKGHENYQILKDETIHFDDKEEAQKVFGTV